MEVGNDDLSWEENKKARNSMLDWPKKTIDYPILQIWSGEERIFMLMALLSCAYLNTNKGIGTIPNEISEDRNSRHTREVRAEFKKKEWRSSFHDDELITL